MALIGTAAKEENSRIENVQKEEATPAEEDAAANKPEIEAQVRSQAPLDWQPTYEDEYCVDAIGDESFVNRKSSPDIRKS